ncbi:prolipoprotein diacylglyceryl transferase [Jhaorihella thermophila]|uniref:Phosphatidylglycerol--prolipoprotein diacylglyceryl transferase n=1 Tax=Jhaorihella thermophila TaxID=488547 RepID=A0A1H5W2Z8_9RHOB|nr:prolipoprotein diacylglyceryl transferase [Jhaorihella thermophila]SEF93872.1 phosphatidylglycerol:prolipoprotein diacylglycerol transferase [Jhaorihella thermophila]
MQAAIQFPDISPEIFSITLFGAEFALRWYALGYILGFLIAWRMALRAISRPALWPDGTSPMTARQIEDLLTWIIIGVIVGGRLGFVLFYQPGYYLQNPAEIPQVWHGGMSFHGGFLGVVIASWLYTARHGIPKLAAADLIAHTVPPGLFLVRIANFINAELWGRPTDLPWGVIFPGPAAQFCPGVTGPCARHPSQLYEAALEGLVLGAVLLWLSYRRGAFHRPGLITGTFLAGYGLARFLVEFLRQPDAQFVSPGNPLGLAVHIGGYGLTMGQILSLPMLAVGLWLIWRSRGMA